MSLPLSGKIEGRFLKAMQERSARWKNVKIASRIEVPVELRWWYWNEFGTATKGDPEHGASGHYYTIVPVAAKELRFPHNGQMVFSKEVPHFGVKPSRSVTKVLVEIRENASAAVHDAFLHGAADDPQILKLTIFHATQKAKELIVESMSRNIPGVREAEPELGRLGGARASDVFEESAEVNLIGE